MRMDLYIELHSKHCVCGGTGWLKKIFRGTQKCQSSTDYIIRYDQWLTAGSPATIEEIFQKYETPNMGRPMEEVKLTNEKLAEEFANRLTRTLEKALTPPPRPAPLTSKEQGKER